jgi:hypothetical protein
MYIDKWKKKKKTNQPFPKKKVAIEAKAHPQN